MKKLQQIALAAMCVAGCKTTARSGQSTVLDTKTVDLSKSAADQLMGGKAPLGPFTCQSHDGAPGIDNVRYQTDDPSYGVNVPLAVWGMLPVKARGMICHPSQSAQTVPAKAESPGGKLIYSCVAGDEDPVPSSLSAQIYDANGDYKIRVTDIDSNTVIDIPCTLNSPSMGELPPPPAKTGQTLSYNDIKGIVDSTCNGCHNDPEDTEDADWDLNNSQDLRHSRATLIEVINSGDMPKGIANWKTTAEAQKLLQWLWYGSEFTVVGDPQ